MAKGDHVDQAYLAAEAKARVQIDRQLAARGLLVQDRAGLNLYANRGVAVREFIVAEGHGRADYLLFVWPEHDAPSSCRPGSGTAGFGE